MKHATFFLLVHLFFTASVTLHGQTDYSRTYTDTLPEAFILNTAELREHIFEKTPTKLRARLDPRATYKFADMSSVQESYRFSSGQIYSDWPSLEAYLNRVMQRVLPEELKDTKYIHAYIVKDGSFNAYMTPSGMMFINIGLIAQVEDEATLAAILAHELGHFFERHSLREYVKLEVGAFDISNNRIRRAARTKFSVHNELESDRLALEWTRRAGFYY